MVTHNIHRYYTPDIPETKAWDSLDIHQAWSVIDTGNRLTAALPADAKAHCHNFPENKIVGSVEVRYAEKVQGRDAYTTMYRLMIIDKIVNAYKTGKKFIEWGPFWFEVKQSCRPVISTDEVLERYQDVYKCSQEEARGVMCEECSIRPETTDSELDIIEKRIREAYCFRGVPDSVIIEGLTEFMQDLRNNYAGSDRTQAKAIISRAAQAPPRKRIFDGIWISYVETVRLLMDVDWLGPEPNDCPDGTKEKICDKLGLTADTIASELREIEAEIKTIAQSAGIELYDLNEILLDFIDDMRKEKVEMITKTNWLGPEPAGVKERICHKLGITANTTAQELREIEAKIRRTAESIGMGGHALNNTLADFILCMTLRKCL